jgi:hypothetical protein
VIHADVRPEKLAVVRIALFGALALYALSVPGERLALLPPGLHHGFGLAAALPDSWFSHGALLALRVAAAVLLLLAAAGARPFRPIAVAGMLLVTLYVSALRPGHRESAALLLGYALSLGPSAAAWSLSNLRKSPRESAPEAFALTLQVATFVFLLTYSFIGVQRLLDGAPEVFRDDSMVWHIASTSERNGSFGFSLGYRFLETMPGARAILAGGFLLATYLEALAPLALFSRWFRWAFVPFAIGFHTVNLLLLNIEFTLNVLVVLLLLVDWRPPRLGRKKDGEPPPPRAWRRRTSAAAPERARPSKTPTPCDPGEDSRPRRRLLRDLPRR